MFVENCFVSKQDEELVSECWTCDDQLPSYQWLRETPVAIVEENEMPQWKTPEQLWDAVTSMGTTFVRYPAIGWGAHFYSESKYLPKYPGMKPDEDFFGAVSTYFKKRGGHVMSYNHFGGVIYKDLADIHPEWLARNTDGTLIPWNDMHYLGCLCSDDFCDSMIQAIDEYCSKYVLDVVYLDAPAWYHDYCHCDGCKKLYREMYQEELPEAVFPNTPEREKFEQMRNARMHNLVKAIHKVTQKHGLPLVVNFRGHNGDGHGDKPLTMIEAEGTNAGEGYRPKASFWSMATLWRMGESFRKIQYAYCPTGTYYNMRSYSSDEAVTVGMAEAMFGMTPFLESATSFLFDKTGSGVLKEICRKIENHREMFYRTSPIKDIALISDERAMCNVPSGMGKMLTKEYQGIIEALSLENRHFECMYERQISSKRLKGYRAVYMPITSYVPDDLKKVLLDYVSEGGTLICGPDFSRRNAEMQEISNYQLADFIGVDFKYKNDDSEAKKHVREYRESAGVFPYISVPEAYVRIIEDFPGMRVVDTPVIPISDTVVRIEPPTYIEYTVAAVKKDTEVLAELFLPAGGCRGENLSFPEGNPPAITRHVYGKGWVYWMAFRPGFAFIRNARFDVSHLIRAICDMPGNGPAVQFDTSGAVLCFLVRNKTNKAWLHLANYSGAMIERSMAPEKILPLSDIRFKILTTALPFEVGETMRVVTEFGNEELKWQLEGSYVCFTLPRLELHQSICFCKK